MPTIHRPLPSSWLGMLLALLAACCPALALGLDTSPPTASGGHIDLRGQRWGEGRHFALDGLWQIQPGRLLTPYEFEAAGPPAYFPVPATWLSPHSPTSGVAHLDPATESASAGALARLDALGAATYRLRVQVPDHINEFHLYVPDMPSAAKLWVNGRLILERGRVALDAAVERPGFRPQVVRIAGGVAVLDMVLQVSNFHYREGGIWFSLQLTDPSGWLTLGPLPVMLAVAVASVLLALGLFNLTLYGYRRKEHTALWFGLLCLVVGGRRLLIDERVVYWLDYFEWATLQRIEHLLFYLSLPLFIAFFAARFKERVNKTFVTSCWLLTLVFVGLCLVLPNRVYTEFNLPFQLLVVAHLGWVAVVFIRVLRNRGGEVADFAISLGVLCCAVLHDVLKANDYLATPNIAHFGVLAFAVTQSLTLQRSYLRSLHLVESMSRQLRSRNQELVAIDSVKDEFLATTSHELRTPLHGIGGLAKILLDEDQGRLDPEQRHRVELIASTADRLGALVNDILDFASIRHGKIRLNTGDFDLSRAADSVIRALQPVVGERDIALSARIDPAVGHLRADPYRLQQVLFNLVGNAVKYTDEGYVQLTASRQGESVVIEVIDSGIGMTQDQVRTLFKPYESAGGSERPGTGLGLTISRELVERHGGNLTIASEPDQGTMVRIHLPAALILAAAGDTTVPLAQINEPSDAIADAHLSGRTKGTDMAAAEPPGSLRAVERRATGDSSVPLVYVVDDEPLNHELVRAQLLPLGLRLECFSEGQSFLRRLDVLAPDLVLLDYVLPGLNGLDLCRLVRRRFDGERLPIMMVTARHQIADMVELLGAGANDYLIKPYFGPELAARVSTILKSLAVRETERENQRLRHEVARREATEAFLSACNTQLLAALDGAAEGVLLLDEGLRVVSLNDRAASWTGDQRRPARGDSLESLLTEEARHALRKWFACKASESLILQLPGPAGDGSWRLTVRHLDAVGGIAAVAAIQPPTTTAQGGPREAPWQGMGSDPLQTVENLVRELGESRNRIERIEGALRDFVRPVGAICPQSLAEATASQAAPIGASEPATNAKPCGSSDQDGKALIVELHRTTLGLWERHTRRSKADLAERSRCWRVYIDGSSVKTRTFDKYLGVRTLPANPRWRAVVRTAHFVMTECGLSDEERQLLMRLTRQVEEAFS